MATEDPFPDVVVGYPKLAAKMEIQPELAIYRRFGALNAQNLLYYQAQLIDLEEQLGRQQAQDDQNATGKKSMYAKTWYRLRESEDDGDTDQLDLVMKIRQTLNEYNAALIQQHTIHSYRKPAKWDIEHMQDYLQTDAMGPLALVGDDAEVWGSMQYRKSYKPDLVALCPRAKKDPFSRWAAENAIVNLFRCGCARFKKPSRVHGVVGYEDGTIYRITYWITSILASMIPIASIVVLYYVQSMPARFGIIAAFNVLVSMCLMGLANAKRAEVFAITAAFAAVQVVFVGTDKSASKSER